MFGTGLAKSPCSTRPQAILAVLMPVCHLQCMLIGAFFTAVSCPRLISRQGQMRYRRTRSTRSAVGCCSLSTGPRTKVNLTERCLPQQQYQVLAQSLPPPPVNDPVLRDDRLDRRHALQLTAALFDTTLPLPRSPMLVRPANGGPAEDHAPDGVDAGRGGVPDPVTPAHSLLRHLGPPPIRGWLYVDTL